MLMSTAFSCISAMKKAKKSGEAVAAQERRRIVAEGLRRKKQAEAKALESVQHLVLSDKHLKDDLRERAQWLNQSYYDDVVEERSCSKLCGYPLCSQSMPDPVKQKYHVSCKLNKVFDLTERKKFCSNDCFKSSSFFRNQLFSGPVWLIDILHEQTPTRQPIQFYDEADSNVAICCYGHEVPISMTSHTSEQDPVDTQHLDLNQLDQEFQSLSVKGDS